MGFFSNLFSDKNKNFNEVIIDQEVLDSVVYYSKEAYPNEFLALFDGEIKDEILYITGLIFLPGDTCSSGAVFRSDLLPSNFQYWGSVHSHPGPSALPSGADLNTFSKHGIFHMIVCLPYSIETFKAYDKHGNFMDYKIEDLSYMIDDDDDTFFDEDDVLKDDEVINVGFFDEDDLDVENPNKDAYENYEKRVSLNNNQENQVVLQIDENGNINLIPLNSFDNKKIKK